MEIRYTEEEEEHAVTHGWAKEAKRGRRKSAEDATQMLQDHVSGIIGEIEDAGEEDEINEDEEEEYHSGKKRPAAAIEDMPDDSQASDTEVVMKRPAQMEAPVNNQRMRSQRSNQAIRLWILIMNKSYKRALMLPSTRL